jgi:hypothetical protein
MSNELNDSLDDLLGGPMGEIRVEPIRSAPAMKPAAERFEEGCQKCNGSGKFISWSGRVMGNCFACKGAGKKVFKSSPEARAKNRESVAARKARIALEGLEAWKEANPAEFDWLKANAERWSLAASLLDNVIKWGSLSEKQMAVIHSGLARDAARIVQREAAKANAPAVDASQIEAAFAKAREKAARPGQMGVMVKPLKVKSGEVSLSFAPGSLGSKWEGMLFAKSVDGKKLGSIKDGKFQRRFECSDAEAAAVLDCAANPKEGLLAFAKAWSKCGVCGRGLLNEVSIERGIGPICMEKFGW